MESLVAEAKYFVLREMQNGMDMLAV